MDLKRRVRFMILFTISFSLHQTSKTNADYDGRPCPLTLATQPSTCLKCPTALDLPAVFSLRFQGAAAGSFIPHEGYTTNDDTLIAEVSDEVSVTTIEQCCAICSNAGNCEYWSWKHTGEDMLDNTGTCEAYTIDQCGFSDPQGLKQRDFDFRSSRTFAFQACQSIE